MFVCIVAGNLRFANYSQNFLSFIKCTTSEIVLPPLRFFTLQHPSSLFKIKNTFDYLNSINSVSNQEPTEIKDRHKQHSRIRKVQYLYWRTFKTQIMLYKKNYWKKIYLASLDHKKPKQLSGRTQKYLSESAITKTDDGITFRTEWNWKQCIYVNCAH